MLATLPRLKPIQLMTAGAENAIPFVPSGVTLATARGAPSPAVAEWIMSVILAQTRLLPRFLADQREDHWDFARSGALAGQTALIVGYGSIGAMVEPLLAAFGVTVERIDRRPRDGVSGLDSLPAALARAGIVIILLPMTPDTRGMVDARFLSQMRDHALLVNAARGPIVDTAALLAELRSGRLRAALDVTDPEPLPAGHPLWSAPGLLLTPGSRIVTARPGEVVIHDHIDGTVRSRKGPVTAHAERSGTGAARCDHGY